VVARPLAAALSLVALWFLAMVLEALRVPVWVLALNAASLLGNLAVLISSLHQATREETRPGGGGGLRASGPDVPGSGGGDEPSWWPELERELTQYLAANVRNRELVRASVAASQQAVCENGGGNADNRGRRKRAERAGSGT
jgi:hypothetical protein